ncbi:hypothetical protein HDU79_010817 [Rhizoclosmatium sp. JEL0117]|nr:hypothetical protein HDU79_010817 [Rhizoclosmatium sp. JEL0117]
MHTYADVFYALKGKEYCLLFYMDKIFDFMSWSLSAVELDSIVLSVVTLLRDFGHTFSEGELFRLYSMEFVELAMEKLDGLDDEISFTYTATVSEFLQCPVCTEPLYEPQRLDNCGHTFCSSCLNEWFTKQRTCPECRGPVKALTPADRIVRNLLDALDVTCNACKVTGPRGRHNDFECQLTEATSYLNQEIESTSIDPSKWPKVEKLLKKMRENPSQFKKLIAVLTKRNSEVKCVGKHAACIDILGKLDGSRQALALATHLPTLIPFLVAGCDSVCNCTDDVLLSLVENYFLPFYPHALDCLGIAICHRLERLELDNKKMADGISTVSRILESVLGRFSKSTDIVDKLQSCVIKLVRSSSPSVVQECVAVANIIIKNGKNGLQGQRLIKLLEFITEICTIAPMEFRLYSKGYLELVGGYFRKESITGTVQTCMACASCLESILKVLGSDVIPWLDALMKLLDSVWRPATFGVSTVVINHDYINAILRVYLKILSTLKSRERFLLHHLEQIFLFMSWFAVAIPLKQIAVNILTLLRDIGYAFPRGELYRLYSMKFIALIMEKLNGIEQTLIDPKLKLDTEAAIKRQLIPITQL